MVIFLEQMLTLQYELMNVDYYAVHCIVEHPFK